MPNLVTLCPHGFGVKGPDLDFVAEGVKGLLIRRDNAIAINTRANPVFF